MIVQFSYPLDKASTVMPGGIPAPRLRARSRMSAPPVGSSEDAVRWNSYNNTSFLDAFVHAGTHVDTPFHVSATGAKLGAYELADFIFDHPLLLEVPKTDDEEIEVSDLEPHEKQLRRADLLLVHTGFSTCRASDPERYLTRQPGFSVAAARYLISLPALRCAGADVMGIENIPKGRAATPPFPTHAAFLLSGRKFLILEDPNTAAIVGRRLKRAYLIPLLFPDAEAMMVTAFAEVD